MELCNEIILNSNFKFIVSKKFKSLPFLFFLILTKFPPFPLCLNFQCQITPRQKFPRQNSRINICRKFIHNNCHYAQNNPFTTKNTIAIHELDMSNTQLLLDHCRIKKDNSCNNTQCQKMRAHEVSHTVRQQFL